MDGVSGSVAEAVETISAQLAVLSKACDELSHRELIGLLSELTRVVRSVPSIEHQVLARLTAETEPCRLGEATWKKVLTTALRVSSSDAARTQGFRAIQPPRRVAAADP